MVKLFKDLNLTADPLNVLLVFDLGLLEYFDSHLE